MSSNLSVRNRRIYSEQWALQKRRGGAGKRGCGPAPPLTQRESLGAYLKAGSLSCPQRLLSELGNHLLPKQPYRLHSLLTRYTTGLHQKDWPALVLHTDWSVCITETIACQCPMLFLRSSPRTTPARFKVAG